MAESVGDDSFLLQIENVRVELRDQFARAHQVLDKREKELMLELQQLEDEYKGEAIAEQIELLEIAKENAISILKGNPNQETLEQSIAPLEVRKRELETSLEVARDRMRKVELEWDTILDGILANTGSIQVRSLPDYKNKRCPVMTVDTYSENTSNPGEFCNARSIAIHLETNNIYIGDCESQQIHVFNRSLKFLFEFKLSDHLNGSFCICINQDKVYVTQIASHSLSVYSTRGEFIQSVGRKGNEELEFEYPRGVAVSRVKNLIYICEWLNDRVQCLNIDLSFNSFISSVHRPRNVQLSPLHIVVLTIGTPCIKLYNFSNQLTNEIISHGEGSQVMRPSFFCLDRELNILMTDYSAHCVLVFSNTGKLLHKFGKRGDGSGDFIHLRGIAVDFKDRIIVVSGNPKYCIQLF